MCLHDVWNEGKIENMIIKLLKQKTKINFAQNLRR